jgi:ABC-type uncharacterized transport system permease subunit
MQEISLFWLRVAAVLYLPGLIYALAGAVRRQITLPRFVLTLFVLGAVLHAVSLVDLSRQTGQFPVQNFSESLSLCAFLLAVLFLFLNWRYRLESLSTLIFPLVCVMTVVAALQSREPGWADDGVRGVWLAMHVTLAAAGYAALFITAAASVFYIIQERRLKSKQMSQRLPPLATLDNVLSRSMGIGFVLITLATIIGSVWGFIESGTRWIADPRIVPAWVTWLGYLAMVSLRVGAGWRGRKVAVSALVVLCVSAVTWATHGTLRSDLLK